MPDTPTPARRRLRAEVAGDVAVITLFDRSLDEGNAEEVGRELSALADALPGARLRLDLAGLAYLSSAGLAKLVALHRRVRAAGGCLALENVGPDVYEVFRVTRLTGVLDVRPRPS